MLLVCRLNQCCCGCTLRTGTLILGILDLIFAVIILISSSTIVSAIVQSDDLSNVDLEGTVAAIKAIYITIAVFSALLILVDVLLLVGVTQSKPGLLTPYMIFVVISAIANVISAIIGASSYFSANDAGAGVTGLIYAFLFLGIKWYFLSVVHSHYTELKNGNNNIPNAVYPPGQTYPNAPQPTVMMTREVRQ